MDYFCLRRVLSTIGSRQHGLRFFEVSEKGQKWPNVSGNLLPKKCSFEFRSRFNWFWFKWRTGIMSIINIIGSLNCSIRCCRPFRVSEGKCSWYLFWEWEFCARVNSQVTLSSSHFRTDDFLLLLHSVTVSLHLPRDSSTCDRVSVLTIFSDEILVRSNQELVLRTVKKEKRKLFNTFFFHILSRRNVLRSIMFWRTFFPLILHRPLRVHPSKWKDKNKNKSVTSKLQFFGIKRQVTTSSSRTVLELSSPKNRRNGTNARSERAIEQLNQNNWLIFPRKQLSSSFKFCSSSGRNWTVSSGFWYFD